MNSIVEEYIALYYSWKQTHYSQPTYDKLNDLYAIMTPDEKAQVTMKLVSKHDK